MAAESSIQIPKWAVMKPKRRAHVERVMKLLECWSRRMDVPAGERRRWLEAAALHDAFRDEDHDALAPQAPNGWPPSLWHGPAAAARARSEGLSDQGILSAIHYHSVGYHGWDQVGRMLYLADYLEPGRKFKSEQRKELADEVPMHSDKILFKDARDRMLWAVRSDLPLMKESVGFWNALARERRS